MSDRERENAAVDALIVLALRNSPDDDEAVLAMLADDADFELSPEDLAALEGIDIKAIIAKAKRLRIAYTTAPVDYDGFGTTTLDPEAGTDDRGRAIRKVGIEPDHWEWQTTRYGSGLHVAATEDEIRRFSTIWRMSKS